MNCTKTNLSKILIQLIYKMPLCIRLPTISINLMNKRRFLAVYRKKKLSIWHYVSGFFKTVKFFQIIIY